MLSYYDPNYWRQMMRQYPYLQFTPPPVMSTDPLEQLGIGRRETIVLVHCPYCGNLVSKGSMFCPRCGYQIRL
ncbi:MAG: zinc ribbon domain-containing protein [Candidatus Bathyarchaeia archaeon]